MEPLEMFMQLCELMGVLCGRRQFTAVEEGNLAMAAQYRCQTGDADRLLAYLKIKLQTTPGDQRTSDACFHILNAVRKCYADAAKRTQGNEERLVQLTLQVKVQLAGRKQLKDFVLIGNPAYYPAWYWNMKGKGGKA